MIALGDVVVLRKLNDSERTTTSGLLALPESAEDLRFAVVGVGPGRTALLDGKLVQMAVKVGHIVLLGSEPQPMLIPGQNLFYCAESDCLAVVGQVAEG